MVKRATLPERLSEKRIPWGPIGKQVYERSYSHRCDDGGSETWPETVVRAVDGNLSLVSSEFVEPGEREKLIDLLFPFAALPAGRHLYASGVGQRQFLFNCHTAGYDVNEPSAHFHFLFDELMKGGGVGSNYSNRYLNEMPTLKSSVDVHVTCRKDHPNITEFEELLSEHDSTKQGITVVVDDSREGWVESFATLIKRVYSESESGEFSITFDVSKIRSRGTPLVTSGGIACGPAPLVRMLLDTTKILNGNIGKCLDSIQTMSIDHCIASCVVAGGKRRSSRMSVKSWKDEDIFEFINCKNQDGSHWTTNISVEVDNEFFAAYKEGQTHARAVMRQVVLGKRNNGEPGIWNIDKSREGEPRPDLIFCPNPCGEIALHQWENCNLGHVNLGYFANRNAASTMEAFRLMSRWLVRATFGDITSSRQRKVVSENRRVGVGFFGFHEWLAMRGIKYSKCYKNKDVISLLKTAKAVVDSEVNSYATQLKIPVPVKKTALAPTGTLVLMPGTTGSGQCMMTPWMKRLVRYVSGSPELELKKKEGYETIVDSDAKNTEIVIYWCEDPLVAKVKNAGFEPSEVLEGQFDIQFSDSLKVQQMLQEHYCDNAISYTINLLPSMMPSEEDMEAELIKFLPLLKGTTIFPEKSRKNSPIQPITKEQFDSYTGPKQIMQVEEECKGACPIK